MATTHILAVGRMSNGHADIRVAPTATDTLPFDGSLQSLIDAGEAVAAAEDALIDALFAASDEDAPAFALDLLGYGPEAIDYAAELDDYADYQADVDFWRIGC